MRISTQIVKGQSALPPIEIFKAGGGVVGDVGEVIANRLAGHDLHKAGFFDGHVGVQALVGHSRFDDLTGELDLHLNGRLIQAVETRSLRFTTLYHPKGSGLLTAMPFLSVLTVSTSFPVL